MPGIRYIPHPWALAFNINKLDKSPFVLTFSISGISRNIGTGVSQKKLVFTQPTL